MQHEDLLNALSFACARIQRGGDAKTIAQLFAPSVCLWGSPETRDATR